MFENVLFQDATTLLSADIQKGKLPQSILLAGSSCAGKLTCALEIARVLSCSGEVVGNWQCTCSSCLKHKSLVSTDLLIAGSRSLLCEIAGARKALLEAYQQNASWIQASRYLFVRAVRKLTGRFNQVLWEGDDKVSKISPLISAIDEILEGLDPLQPLIEIEKFEKLSLKLLEHCEKLENSFMYDSIPVSHIRRAQSWAHYTITSGKRVFIIENADKMQEGVRNALLKILEEPPEHCVFVLIAENRNAVMPTILSRVRTYTFGIRKLEQNTEVLKRIYRISDETLQSVIQQSNIQGETVISAYLNSFLPISSDEITHSAQVFIQELQNKKIPNTEELLKSMKNFEPRSVLKLFFNAILDTQRKQLIGSDAVAMANASEQSAEILDAVKKAYSNITIYNQSVTSAFETLIYSILKVS